MSDSKFIGYQCSLCAAQYNPDDVTYTCPKDDGNLDVILDFEGLRRKKIDEFILRNEASLWRYLPLLPVDDPGGKMTPFRAAGWTPVFSVNRLAKQLGLRNLWVKDESRNPSASFKDRASSVVIARAREIGAEVVVTASTGNAGAALAGMAAAIGQKTVIFAPCTAPPAKIAQLLIYGAKVLLVDGSYDDAFDLTIQASHEFGWYCRNTGYNPFTAEGKKTAALEIWEWWENLNPHNLERLRNINLSIFIPVGDGNIISGVHKGFKDLKSLDLLDTLPRIFGVQSEGSAAVANAYFAATEKITPVSAKTIADSISVDLPRDGVRALRAATQTGGTFIIVSDADILAAIAELGRVGIFAEPAGAAAFAGLVKAVQNGQIKPDDAALVLNTGSGLKDIKAAMQAVHEAPVIEPTIKAVKAHISDFKL
ncbi:MAG: threonine synthase [Anaerolineales bacterium]|nr:threonine synthase [Anaerolineales bacterium]